MFEVFDISLLMKLFGHFMLKVSIKV